MFSDLPHWTPISVGHRIEYQLYNQYTGFFEWVNNNEKKLHLLASRVDEVGEPIQDLLLILLIPPMHIMHKMLQGKAL